MKVTSHTQLSGFSDYELKFSLILEFKSWLAVEGKKTKEWVWKKIRCHKLLQKRNAKENVIEHYQKLY